MAATTTPANVAPAPARTRHPAARAFFTAPGGIVGLTIVLALVVLAIIGPIVWGPAAHKSDLSIAYQSSSAAHPLGTDSLGRDILARTLTATRLTLLLGLAAAAISMVLGFALGTTIAALAPRARGFGRRAIEVFMSFPPILLALFLVTIIGTGATGAVIAIGIGAAPAFARLAENCATSVSSKEYVASARVSGVGRPRIIGRYLLPNMSEPLVLAGLAYFAGAIIDISGLNFLGVGVQTPQFDWGTELTTGVQAIYTTPWAAVAPAAAITITGIAIVYLGEATARSLNPRLWRAGKRRDRKRAAAAAPAPAGAAADTATVADADDAVLRIEGLDVVVPGPDGPRKLVRDVSLALRPGEALGIVGETGSGKTLTALSLAGLVPHPLQRHADRLELDGVEVTSLNKRQEARLYGTHIAMIFQDPMSSMNPSARVGAQLVDGARRHRSLSRKAARAEAQERLAEVRIGDGEKALKRYPYQFSGGMQQRLMIAMGLMARPRVLIADEPTTALDVTVQAQVLDVLKDIKAREGMAIVLISHNLGVVNQLCDRIVVMYHGAIVEEGVRGRLLRNPRHPYTQGLMNSILELSPDGSRTEVTGIRGRPPAPGEEPPGCPFADRCPIAFDRCRRERPTLTDVGDGDRVACFAATGGLSEAAA
jgi:peptide/nickel transport system permease protein